MFTFTCRNQKRQTLAPLSHQGLVPNESRASTKIEGAIQLSAAPYTIAMTTPL